MASWSSSDSGTTSTACLGPPLVDVDDVVGRGFWGGGGNEDSATTSPRSFAVASFFFFFEGRRASSSESESEMTALDLKFPCLTASFFSSFSRFFASFFFLSVAFFSLAASLSASDELAFLEYVAGFFLLVSTSGGVGGGRSTAGEAARETVVEGSTGLRSLLNPAGWPFSIGARGGST